MIPARAAAIVVVFFLLSAACGGGDEDPAAGASTTASTTLPATQPDSGSSARSVTSDDGMLELALPAGAVEDSVDVRISATSGNAPTDPDAFQGYAYTLEPSGISFDEPVVATLTIPFSDRESIPVVIAGLGTDATDLEQVPTSATVQDGELTVTAQIAHFSLLEVWVAGNEVSIVHDCQDQMTVGDSCTVAVDAAPDLEVDFFKHGNEHFELMEPEAGVGVYTCTSPTEGSERFVDVTITANDLAVRAIFLAAFGALMDTRGDSQVEEWLWTECVAGEAGPPPTDDPASEIDGGVAATVTDPEGDWTEADALAARGFSGFERPPPDGTDITDVSVAYAPDGSRTIVTVTFKGPGRALETEDGRSVTIRPIVRRDGEYFFEMQYRKGSSFVSSGPEGAELTVEWIDDNRIRFVLDGFVPMAGDEVRIVVFSENGTGDAKEVAEDEARVQISS